MNKLKKAVKKLIPGSEAISMLLRKVEKIELDINHVNYQIETKITKILEETAKKDNRLDQLKKSYKDVEPYQPLYGITGYGEDEQLEIKRSTKDRCDLIYDYFDNRINRMRFLDIGSSLGFVCFYLADRGAYAEGWDYYPKNTEVSQNLQSINGMRNVHFISKELNVDTARSIKSGDFDAVIVLNVFHHLINLYGLDYTKKIVSELLERVPYLIVELATKGEDPKLSWNNKLPKNELEILGDYSNYKVEKIGEFATHLSDKKRPMYVISKKNISVNNKIYNVSSHTLKPYKKAPGGADSQREYFTTTDNMFIKKYNYEAGIADNKRQIINEINVLMALKDKKIDGVPEITDFEINGEDTKVVIKKIQGTLLSETELSVGETESTARQLLKTLSDLEAVNIQHNDLRSWNIITDKKESVIIDFGLSGPTGTENNQIAFLWVIYAALTGRPESFDQNKTSLPEKDVFKDSKKLLNIYENIEKDPNTNFKKLSEQFSK